MHEMEINNKKHKHIRTPDIFKDQNMLTLELYLVDRLRLVLTLTNLPLPILSGSVT